ncbi:MAG: hypothetical protein JXR37_21050 [Kiritimatiellae bacterium]|nr:hypothetical protein [Kiritimatiellia bacterium]
MNRLTHAPVVGLLVVCVALLLCTPALAASVTEGDTLQTVLKTLGKPRGEMNVKGSTVLIYDTLIIEMRDGRVAAVQDLAAKKRMARVQARKDAEQQKAQRARLMAEGQAKKDKTLADPEFAKLTGKKQVAFWELFAKQYPDVDVRAELADAKKKAAKETPAEAQATGEAVTGAEAGGEATTGAQAETKDEEKDEKKEDEKELTPRQKQEKLLKELEAELAAWPETYGKTHGPGPRRRARQRLWKLENELIPAAREKLDQMPADQ